MDPVAPPREPEQDPIVPNDGAAGVRTRGRYRLEVLSFVAVGVLLRLLILFCVHPLDLRADEVRYVYLALSWNRFGILADTSDFVWPPGQTFLLAHAFEWLGAGGILGVKLLFVALSGVIGLFTLRLAERVFDRRAARIAGVLWCLHLPLGAYTHLLWPEPVYLALILPAAYLLLTVQDTEGRSSRSATLRVLAAGFCLGLSMLFKEVGVGLGLLCAVWVALAAGHCGRAEAMRRASLLALSMFAVIAPWILRNHEVYGEWTSTGVTLGDNAYRGLNAHYKNFDTSAFNLTLGEASPWHRARPWFTDPGELEAWPRARREMNTVRRSRTQLRSGATFAREHPGYFLRSRLKRLADFVTPLSFYVRHQALGMYTGGISGPWVRRGLLVLAILLTLGCWIGGALGAAVVHGSAARRLFALVIVYHAAASLLISMSRFSVPVIPFLIVLTAGALTRSRARGAEEPAGGEPATALASVLAWGLRIGGVGILLTAWWIDLPEVLGVLELAW